MWRNLYQSLESDSQQGRAENCIPQYPPPSYPFSGSAFSFIAELNQNFRVFLAFSCSIYFNIQEGANLHPLVVGLVIGSNLGPTPRHNLRRKKWFLMLLTQLRYKNNQGKGNALAQNKHNPLKWSARNSRTKVVQSKSWLKIQIKLSYLRVDIQQNAHQSCSWLWDA